MMLEFDLKIQRFCHTVVQPMIDCGGFAFVSPNTGTILFYAGPSDDVLQEIQKQEGENYSASHYPPNWTLTKTEAERLGALRIDDTVLFPVLMSDEFVDHLVSSCGLSEDEKDKAIKQVWRYVSNKFARMDFRKAATLVCGASQDSAFFTDEMLSMLEEPYLKILNECPADLFRAFRAFGKNEVHGLMMATYLLDMKRQAVSSGEQKAWKNYKRQRKYFLASRRKDKILRKSWPADFRDAFKKIRKDILSRFVQRNKAPKRKSPLCRFPIVVRNP